MRKRVTPKEIEARLQPIITDAQAQGVAKGIANFFDEHKEARNEYYRKYKEKRDKIYDMAQEWKDFIYDNWELFELMTKSEINDFYKSNVEFLEFKQYKENFNSTLPDNNLVKFTVKDKPNETK